MSRLFFIIGLLLLVTALPAIAQEKMTNKKGFTLSESEEHYFLFVLNNRPADLPELRGEITKYLWVHYPNERLKITQVELGGDLENIPVLFVKSFSGKADALAFYKALKARHPDFLHMGMTQEYFPISKSNFDIVVENNSLEAYKVFFERSYQ